MPRFDYRCTECGDIHERRLAIDADIPRVVDCPNCDSPTALRVWTAPYMHAKPGEFVGKHGVYKNDASYEYLYNECWPKDNVDTTPKVNVNGTEVQTYTSEQAQAMTAQPTSTVKKKRT